MVRMCAHMTKYKHKRDFGRIWKFMYRYVNRMDQIYFKLPQTSFNVYPGFRKQNTVISYLFVRSSSQVLCDLMSIVSVYAYASIILLQPVVDSQQFPLVFFHLCLLKEWVFKRILLFFSDNEECEVQKNDYWWLKSPCKNWNIQRHFTLWQFRVSFDWAIQRRHHS